MRCEWRSSTLIDGEQDIFPRREPGQQRRGLKHHAAVQSRPDYFAPGDDHAAFAGIVESHGDRQDRRLAAPRVTDDADKFTFADTQVEILDDDRPPLIGIVTLAQLCEF